MKQGLGSYPGIADLYILRRGDGWWLEVKMPGRNLSPVQREFRDWVIIRGGKYAVVSSIEELRAFGFIDNLIL